MESYFRVSIFFLNFSFFFLCRAMNSINWVLLRQWYWDTGDKFTPGNSYWSLGTVGISVHKQVKKKKKKSRYLFSSCQVCNLAKKKRWLVLLAVASKWYPVTMILNVSGSFVFTSMSKHWKYKSNELKKKTIVQKKKNPSVKSCSCSKHNMLKWLR